MAKVTAFNITIDDTSPQIIYSPFLSTPIPDLQTSWDQYFADSGFSVSPGQLGLGESLHITEKDGATLTINFTGIAIYLYGLTVSSSVSFELDNTPTPLTTAIRQLNDTVDASAGLLASFSGLSQSSHVLSLTAHTATNAANDTTGVLIFDRAVVTVSTELTEASVTTKIINDTEMQFTGSWTFVNDSTLIPSGDHSCHITQSSGDQATYTFQGSSVELHGLTNATSGLFNVTLTSDSDQSIIEQQQITGLSSFLTYTTLFYATGLDQTSNHTLTITNIENKTLAVDGMNVTVISGGHVIVPSSHSDQHAISSGLSRGTVAAIVVAASLGCLLFAGVLAYVLCMRKRPRYWWDEKGHMYAYDDTMQPRPRHRRVRSTDILHIDQPRPGQGLNTPPVIDIGYSYRNTVTDEMTELGRIEEADTDSAYGHEQKNTVDDVPRPSSNRLSGKRPADVDVSRTRSPGRSLTRSRWPGWLGSPSRSGSPNLSARSIPIVAPRPTRAFPSPSALARSSFVSEGQSHRSHRSSSFANFPGDETSSDAPPASPFGLESGKEDAERSGDATETSFASPVARGTQTREMLVSFLDIASSAASSLRGSSRSRSRRQSKSSKSSSGTGNGNGKRQRRARHSSGHSNSASTGMWTVSLSVDPPPRRRTRSSEEPVPTTAIDTDGTPSRHPYATSEGGRAPDQESPTDSIPMSVSDINFRSGEEEEEDPIRHSGRFHLPRHPPLPVTPLSFTFSSVREPEQPEAAHVRRSSSTPIFREHSSAYVAQTSFGRRLAQVRASAQEHADLITHAAGHSSSPSQPDRHVRNNSRSRNLPFMNFGRTGQGS